MSISERTNKITNLLNSWREIESPSYDWAESVLWHIRRNINEEQSLAGLRILDLGCGAGMPERDARTLWHPAFLFLTAQEGAYGVGVDLYDYPEAQGVYEHIEVNLITYLNGEKNLSSLFKNLSNEYQPPFDLIIESNFLGNLSPTLKDMLGLPEGPVLNGVLTEMKSTLLNQAKDIGKDGTLVIVGGSWHFIIERDLIEIPQYGY